MDLERVDGCRSSGHAEHLDLPGVEVGHVQLVRADPSDPFLRTFTPEAQGQTLFEAILQDPARSSTGNLGRVKLIRADPRDPFIQYFEGSR